MATSPQSEEKTPRSRARYVLIPEEVAEAAEKVSELAVWQSGTGLRVRAPDEVLSSVPVVVKHLRSTVTHVYPHRDT